MQMLAYGHAKRGIEYLWTGSACNMSVYKERMHWVLTSESAIPIRAQIRKTLRIGCCCAHHIQQKEALVLVQGKTLYRLPMG